MTNLDGLCQGGPEGEEYPKLPGLVKRPKTNKKEVWKSLVRASSSAHPTQKKKKKKKKKKEVGKSLVRASSSAQPKEENKEEEEEIGRGRKTDRDSQDDVQQMKDVSDRIHRSVHYAPDKTVASSFSTKYPWTRSNLYINGL